MGLTKGTTSHGPSAIQRSAENIPTLRRRKQDTDEHTWDAQESMLHDRKERKCFTTKNSSTEGGRLKENINKSSEEETTERTESDQLAVCYHSNISTSCSKAQVQSFKTSLTRPPDIKPGVQTNKWKKKLCACCHSNGHTINLIRTHQKTWQESRWRKDKQLNVQKEPVSFWWPGCRPKLELWTRLKDRTTTTSSCANTAKTTFFSGSSQYGAFVFDPSGLMIRKDDTFMLQKVVSSALTGSLGRWFIRQSCQLASILVRFFFLSVMWTAVSASRCQWSTRRGSTAHRTTPVPWDQD